MRVVYVNGEYLEDEKAVVSVFDHGLLTGDGVFESVVIRHGKPFALTRHLDRLQRSADVLGLSCPPLMEIEAVAREVAERAGLSSGKIRITLTGGPGPLGSGRGTAGPSLVVACEPLVDVPETASVVVVPWPRNERGALAGAKTISYAENVVALSYARQRGATEALFLNLSGLVCEGTGSNIFLGLGGELVTPPLSSGCLAGVTRGLLLELTGARESDITRDELDEADEAFLTSTTRGVQPISTLEDRPLSPCPGPLTREAEKRFSEIAARGGPDS